MVLPGFLSQRKYRVYIVSLIGTFITVVDTTAAFVAVPTRIDLNVGLPVAQWVILGNMLAVTAILVPIGRLSDVLGRKRLFVVGYLVMGLGAIMASLAPGMLLLTIGRVVMGMGAALAQATSIPIVISAFSPAERGRVLGGQMGVVGVGTVLGPVLGGAIVGPCGVAGDFLGHRRRVHRCGRARRPGAATARGARGISLRDFDLPGALLSMGCLVALLLGLSNGARVGWGAASVLSSLAISVVLGVALAWQERRARDPMLDVALFRLPDFSVGLLSALIAFSASSGAYFLMPFYLQMVKGFSPEMLGLLLMPAGIVTALVSPPWGCWRIGSGFVALPTWASPLTGWR